MMSALLLVLLLGLMLTVPFWTLNRFAGAKAAWIHVGTAVDSHVHHPPGIHEGIMNKIHRGILTAKKGPE